MMIKRRVMKELLRVTLKDLPDLAVSDIDFKWLYELWGHPIIALIKSGQPVPVGLRIYYNIPAAWVLEWKRKWG